MQEGNMKCAAFVMAIGIVLLSLTQTSAAQSFTQVIVFGDSNVDSGFYRLLGNPGGGSTFNADWSTAVAHGAGGPTTNPGLMSVQYLAAFFGLTANPSNTAGRQERDGQQLRKRWLYRSDPDGHP